MIYKIEDVKAKTLEYFNGDDLATNVWIDKYCLKDSSGNLLELSPDDMHKRLAKEFYRIEQKYPNPISYEEIYTLLSSWSIIPGGSLLYGIGNNHSISSLGNCFVVDSPADSYGGIFTTDQELAQLMKRRAGVGTDISTLRPKNAKVSNAAGSSTGAASFMHRYSNTTREVAQSGRRGALMLTMDISHPDVDQFITVKDDLTKVTGANISVKVDDAFMQRRLKMDAHKERGLWKTLVHQAWKSAEPGLLFWDKIKSESIPSCYGSDWQEVSTNPCGEIPLCAYDSCRLLSVNLTRFVKNPFTDKAEFDWKEFERVTYIAQKLMDDVIDLEEEKINKILEKIDNDPEDEKVKAVEKDLWFKIKDKLLMGRRTGHSAIGLGDTLAMLDISYSSGIDIAESIYKNHAISAYKSSIDMAKDRGAFSIWKYEKELDNLFLNRLLDTKEITDAYFDRYLQYGRRNIALLTIPPSGTISLLAGISSGIEPVYQLSYKRRRKVDPNHPNISFTDKNGDCWEEYIVYHSGMLQWMKVVEEGKHDGVNSPYNGSTSHELDPLDRVKMQGVIQKWIDHSISSTVNLHKDTTEEEVSNIYIEAWKQGLKGITIYRDGCRDGVLVSSDSKQEEDFFSVDAPKRPKELDCDIYYTTSKGIPYNVVIGLYEGKPYEIFATTEIFSKKQSKGKLVKVNRGHYKVIGDVSKDHLMEHMADDCKVITRALSALLRHRAHLKFAVDTLHKFPGKDMFAFNRVLARILKKYIKDDEVITGTTCSECGSTDLIYKDGCSECLSCGNSHCS